MFLSHFASTQNVVQVPCVSTQAHSAIPDPLSALITAKFTYTTPTFA